MRVTDLREGDLFVWDAELGECEMGALYVSPAESDVIVAYRFVDGPHQTKRVPASTEVDLINRIKTLPE
jgi:hypothetical protein